MRPTFTTEIGRMRAEEMHLRAQRRHVARMAQSAPPTLSDPAEDTAVVAERRKPFTLRRIFAFATAVFSLMVALATTAFAMPVGPGSGGASQGLGPIAPSDQATLASTFDYTGLLVAAVLIAAAAGAVYAILNGRSSPRVA